MTEWEFEDLVAARYLTLVKTAKKRLRGTGLREEAEDLVQEALRIVWEKREQVTVTEAIGSFFSTVLLDLATNAVRRKARYVDPSRKTLKHLAKCPEPSNRSSLQADVAEALDAVEDPVCRQAAWMVYAEDWRLKEVAAAMKIPLATLHRRLQQEARPILQSALKGYRTSVSRTRCELV